MTIGPKDFCEVCREKGEFKRADNFLNGVALCASCIAATPVIPEPKEEEIVVSVEPEKVEAAIEEENEPLEMVHLVATDTMQMVAAQAGLTAWLKDKIADIDGEIAEVSEARDYAKSHKWRVTTFVSQISRAEKRKLFYTKLLMAAEAGYTVIPNLPIDILAIRTTAFDPKDTGWKKYYNGAAPSSHFKEKCETLPAGYGDYVSPIPKISRYKSTEKQPDGKIVTTYMSRATALKEMEFPVIVGVPAVMDATSKAMALKVFDQIGICPSKNLREGFDSGVATQLPPARQPDPLIVGQILTPKIGYSGERPVSFLIAWHLDLRTL